jgi:hypothetical protein
MVAPIMSSEVDSGLEVISEIFEKTRIYNNGSGLKFVPEFEIMNLIENAEKQEDIKQILKDNLVKGEHCNFYAKLPVPKIFGTLTFLNLVDPLILKYASELGFSVQIKAHRFNSLRFKNGADSMLTEDDPFYMEDFDEADVESLDRIKEINQQKYIESKKPIHVMYFVQAVPHIIYDEYSRKDLYSYSYSVNHNIRSHNSGSGVSLFYDFSPLTMRMVKRVKSPGKLIIDI